MKQKLLTLFALLAFVGGGNFLWAATETISWKASSVPTGGIVDHPKSDVLQIAFGTAVNNNTNNWKVEAGSVTVSYGGKDYSFDKYATTSNVNGAADNDLAANGSSAKNYIAFIPKYDGTLIIVAHNLGTGSDTKYTCCYEDGIQKSGTIIGNGSLNIAYDGHTDVKILNGGTAVTGGIKINVTANKVYTFSQSGSKARWMGIIFEYESGAKTTTTKNAEKTNQTYYAYNDVAYSGDAVISSKVDEVTFKGICNFAGTNIQNGSIMFTIGGKTYKSFKVAKGSTYTLTPEAGITINNASLYALSNDDVKTIKITTGSGDTETGNRTANTTPTEITLTKNADEKFYFTVSNESAANQGIIVLVINYDKAENVDVTISDAGYATLYYDKKLAIPAGVTAYAATVKDAETITLTEIENVIPANTGVILKADAGKYNFVVTNADAPAVDNNILVGTTTATTKAALGGTVYTLGQDGEGVVGLRSFTGTDIRAYSAYATSIAASARGFFTFETKTTGVKAIEKTQSANNAYYNLAGQRVAQPQKGLYIVNGKKVIIK